MQSKQSKIFDRRKYFFIFSSVCSIKLTFFQFARQFYIAQWFRDTTKEKRIKNKKNEEEDFDEAEAEQTTEKMKDAERRTQFLMKQVEANLKPYSSHKYVLKT